MHKVDDSALEEGCSRKLAEAVPSGPFERDYLKRPCSMKLSTGMDGVSFQDNTFQTEWLVCEPRCWGG
jgi:hypothetical protein